ncbi:serine/threonine protein kinase [Thalassotalea mangrovi]|uniref:Serine/threonine protein kinase n=1 Tax=Thalassotalea mangrovi TaxID=2572245 RepID=A0A4U1B276_9GAMM|nr:phosphotransferase [Thalassotalea mangrovi]TKB43628.1 serine/threonine protein kinase [Thalassotalea mangrovi]
MKQNTAKKKLQHFYIAEEQSIYLLSHKDAEKLKQWIELCKSQLREMGFNNIELLGKGAYGFVFCGENAGGEHQVFKFSRITLPQHVQDRLADEALMQGTIDHPNIPQLIEYRKIKRQSILQMRRAPGVDMEVYSHQHGPLPPELVVTLAIQLMKILQYLKDPQNHQQQKLIVHGDIKPSNLVFDPITEKIQLIDWGSSVWAQVDNYGQSTASNVMDLMSDDLQHTNARMGDVYFIGEEQLNGGLSSPRFDEQGMAATLYALASGQSCRYGYKVITASSLGLPKVLGKSLDAMLGDDADLRRKAGDYLFSQLPLLERLVLNPNPKVNLIKSVIPVWVKPKVAEMDTVVYGSRKSFLRESSERDKLVDIDDIQLEKYYKNFLVGMGATEKAFIAAVSRLARYPVVGGLAIRWEKEGVYVDSNLTLFDQSLETAFKSAVNNMVTLAQGIFRIGIFKSCLFDARNTLHIERKSVSQPFKAAPEQFIPFEVSNLDEVDKPSRLHSYFEDGKDPDEYLRLPDKIMAVLTRLNKIHHTGCIIFEVLDTHLKIHSYLMLLNHAKRDEFAQCLQEIIELLPTIKGLGISGFMKLPYKDTRFFEHINQLPDKFYPKNPKQHDIEIY